MQKTKSKSKPKASKRRAVVSAQQTIPYVAMHPDGICQLPGGLYTKTVEYEDIKRANRLLYATAFLCEGICLLVMGLLFFI